MNKIAPEGNDVLEEAVANAQRAVESVRKYIESAEALWNYIEALNTGTEGDGSEKQPLQYPQSENCAELPGEYAIAVGVGGVRFRDSVASEWQNIQGTTDRSILIILREGNRLKSPQNNQYISAELVKLGPTGVALCSNITLPFQDELVYVGEGQFQARTSYGTFLDYWCEVKNECNQEELGERRDWFVDPAAELNLEDFTNLSDEAFAALLYSRVINEGRWEQNAFNLNPNWEFLSDLAGTLIPGYRGFNEWWDRNRPPRLQGISWGLPNFFEGQAMAAAEWLRSLPDSYGVSSVPTYIDFSSMLEHPGEGIEWYARIVSWGAWRNWTNVPDVAGSEPYDLNKVNMLLNSRQYTPRRPNEQSAFGIQATINTDAVPIVGGVPADTGELVGKTLHEIENLQAYGRELGFDLRPGIDFIPYTAEEAKWLVEVVQIANLDDFPLLKATYCGLPDADRTKCNGS